jgi:hypothetical protein
MHKRQRCYFIDCRLVRRGEETPPMCAPTSMLCIGTEHEDNKDNGFTAIGGTPSQEVVIDGAASYLQKDNKDNGFTAIGGTPSQEVLTPTAPLRTCAK